MGDKPSNHLSAAQIVAGAMASVSAAVIASIFGVTGTIIGAALTSVTVTIGSTLYKQSLERAHSRVRSRSHQDPSPSLSERESSLPPRRTLAWGTVIAGAGLVFVLAMGTLTGVEALAKTPAAALMGNAADRDVRSATTVGTVLQVATSQVDDEVELEPVPVPTEAPTGPVPSDSRSSQPEPSPLASDDGRSSSEVQEPAVEPTAPNRLESPEPSIAEPDTMSSVEPALPSPEP